MIRPINELPTTDALLVIRCNAFLKPGEFSRLTQSIYEQKEKCGMVVLPPYCEALVVPRNMDISVESMGGENDDGE